MRGGRLREVVAKGGSTVVMFFNGYNTMPGTTEIVKGVLSRQFCVF